jgi:membrane-associated HD superfamily phosphohydrolase
MRKVVENVFHYYSNTIIVMSSKKTIKINPELFNLSGGNKTQKNRERKARPTKAPLINPNTIKKELLNRIKEHKNNENKKREKSSEKVQEKEKEKEQDIGGFTDEFMDSINYLSSLSKEKKEIDASGSVGGIGAFEKRRSSSSAKTLKKPPSYSSYNYGSSHPIPYVHLEMHEDLKESPLVPITHFPLVIESAPEIKINPIIQQDVPYGCLKGGKKPTYRTWNSRKNYDNMIPQTTHFEQPKPVPTSIPTPTPTSMPTPISTPQPSDRAQRLKVLQDKLKQKRQTVDDENSLMSGNLITFPTEVETETALHDLVEEYVNEPKKVTKRTIRRKYTLGKSAIKKRVGVLIKDNKSRKNVVKAHKELKKKPLTDVKNYLRDHGLLKVGSNAPNDVIRKIYEASMMTGDVTNNSKDVLLHNFLSETES